MLWIFKVARWTCDRWPKINISPTVSNGIGASSFEIWTANLAQSLPMGTLTNSQSFIFGDSNWKFCKVGYPIGPPKPDIQMQTFLTWDLFIFFLMLLFFSEKNQNLLLFKRTMYSQTGKNMKWAETFVWCLLSIFKVGYQGHLTQLLPFTGDFVGKGQQLVWGQGWKLNMLLSTLVYDYYFWYYYYHHPICNSSPNQPPTVRSTFSLRSLPDAERRFFSPMTMDSSVLKYKLSPSWRRLRAKSMWAPGWVSDGCEADTIQNNFIIHNKYIK